MSDAIHRRDEADRLLNEPLLNKALADLEAQTIDELLSGPPTGTENADQWRRERIDTVNTVRAIPQAIRAAMYSAEAEMRTRGSVA